MSSNDYHDIENTTGKYSTVNKVKILGFAKNIKFYAFIDTLFDLYITIFVFWPFIFLVFLSICGVYGANKFDSRYIYAYLIGDFIKLICKVFIAIYSPTIPTLIISWIICFISLLYINTIFRFYKQLTYTSIEDIGDLQAGWEPRRVRFVF